MRIMNGTGDQGITPQSPLQFELSWAEVEQLLAVTVEFIVAMRGALAAYRVAPPDKHADKQTAELDAVLKQVGAACALVKQIDRLLGDKVGRDESLDLAALELPLSELAQQLLMLKYGRIDRLLHRVPFPGQGPGGPTLMPPDREWRATVGGMVEAFTLVGKTADLAATEVVSILDGLGRKLPGRTKPWKIAREWHRRRAKNYPADTPDVASAHYHDLVVLAQAIKDEAIKGALDPLSAMQDFARTVLERHT